MIVSLNEVEMTALKAARGAGYSWGLAEEAGKAVRWLAERQQRRLDWLAPLLAILNERPEPRRCPLTHGAALADDPVELLASGTATWSEIVAPGLLLPFVVRAARVLGEPLLIEWDGVQFRTSSAEDAIACRAWYALTRPAVVATTRGAPMPLLAPLRRKSGGVSISTQSWQYLAPFAQRTYVPQSETSRLTGAGAGLNDND